MIFWIYICNTKPCNPSYCLDNSNKEKEPNFYSFICHFCNLEGITEKCVITNICIEFRPESGKKLDFFQRIVSENEQTEYFCACKNCLLGNFEWCRYYRCKLCTKTKKQFCTFN